MSTDTGVFLLKAGPADKAIEHLLCGYCPNSDMIPVRLTGVLLVLLVAMF